MKITCVLWKNRPQNTLAMLERLFSHAHALLNHDFCPRANKWVYWMKHPLACLGAAALVAFSCGLFVNPAGFLAFAAIGVVGAMGIVWPWFTVRGLTVEAEFLQVRCRVGQSVLVHIRIANQMPLPAWGLFVRRGFLGATDSQESGLALARVSGWSLAEYEWLFTPPQRGVYPVGEAQLDTGFPFGLWHATLPIQMQNELVVWPRSVTLDAMPDAAEIQTREDQLTERRPGYSGEMVGIRPYREGDSLRRVHWQQTARTGRLIVMERQAPATCAIRLVVEVNRIWHIVKPYCSTLEQTLSVAASLLESLHRQHALVELQVHDQVLVIGSSQVELRRALDLLAKIPPTGVAGDSTCYIDQSPPKYTTIAVTTRAGLAHHQGHRHVTFGERFIVIRSTGDEENLSPAEGCDCHQWIEVSCTDDLAEVLPASWRRACHVA